MVGVVGSSPIAPTTFPLPAPIGVAAATAAPRSPLRLAQRLHAVSRHAGTFASRSECEAATCFECMFVEPECCLPGTTADAGPARPNCAIRRVGAAAARTRLADHTRNYLSS